MGTRTAAVRARLTRGLQRRDDGRAGGRTGHRPRERWRSCWEPPPARANSCAAVSATWLPRPWASSPVTWSCATSDSRDHARDRRPERYERQCGQPGPRGRVLGIARGRPQRRDQEPKREDDARPRQPRGQCARPQGGERRRADEHGCRHRRRILDHVPRDARRILDLGTGDGRLLALLRMDRPDSARFADQASVEFVRHDLAEPMPDLGSFDAVVSCLAIQHVHDTRKRTLYAEAFDRLVPGGVFCNLEHVASPTARLHRAFYQALGYARTCWLLPITCSTWRRSLAGLCLRGPSRLPAEMPPVKNVGEPCSGEPHARIDGGRKPASVGSGRATPGTCRLPDQPPSSGLAAGDVASRARSRLARLWVKLVETCLRAGKRG
jgi:Methyltransferase domain